MDKITKTFNEKITRNDKKAHLTREISAKARNIIKTIYQDEALCDLPNLRLRLSYLQKGKGQWRKHLINAILGVETGLLSGLIVSIASYNYAFPSNTPPEFIQSFWFTIVIFCIFFATLFVIALVLGVSRFEKKADIEDDPFYTNDYEIAIIKEKLEELICSDSIIETNSKK